MDLGSIFLLFALLIPVVIYIIRPLLEHGVSTVSPAGQDISTLLAQRDQVVASLQELDEDYHLGKIPEDNYPTRRTSLLQNGADILRRIDLQQASSEAGSPTERLEAALVAHRNFAEEAQPTARKNGNAVPPVPDDDLEQRIASRRRTKQTKAGGFCPKCGRPVQADDRFCPRCGATLS